MMTVRDGETRGDLWAVTSNESIRGQDLFNDVSTMGDYSKKGKQEKKLLAVDGGGC